MDPKSTFIKRFGDLVALLRADPGNDAAQELALEAAAAAVADAALRIEAGVEWHVIPEEMTLKARMLARQVDAFSVAAGTSPQELQSFARALAHDVTPIPRLPNIEVELVRLLARPLDPPGGGGGGVAPGGSAGGLPAEAGINRRLGPERRQSEDRRLSSRARWQDIERRGGGDRRMSGERRLILVKDQRVTTARLLSTLSRACQTSSWEAALYTLQQLVRLAPRIPQAERRAFGIQVRRAVPRPVLEALVGLTERDPAVRSLGAEVFRWIGLDAVEVILDRLREGEALEVRLYFYDIVGRIPAAYRLVTPMLRGHRSHEVRHGAALLGRLGLPGAVKLLRPLLDHPDELVRLAAVCALGELHAGPSADGLRDALRHRSPGMRAAAAAAITQWRSGVLALLVAAALEKERDRDTWHAMVSALGRIGTPDACAALARIALTRRSLLRLRGYTTEQRLAAVTALGLADTTAGHATLERLARDNEAVVSYAADRVLQAEALRVG
jgi:HEAT repeat protein